MPEAGPPIAPTASQEVACPCDLYDARGSNIPNPGPVSKGPHRGHNARPSHTTDRPSVPDTRPRRSVPGALQGGSRPREFSVAKRSRDASAREHSYVASSLVRLDRLRAIAFVGEALVSAGAGGATFRCQLDRALRITAKGQERSLVSLARTRGVGRWAWSPAAGHPASPNPALCPQRFQALRIAVGAPREADVARVRAPPGTGRRSGS